MGTRRCGLCRNGDDERLIATVRSRRSWSGSEREAEPWECESGKRAEEAGSIFGRRQCRSEHRRRTRETLLPTRPTNAVVTACRCRERLCVACSASRSTAILVCTSRSRMYFRAGKNSVSPHVEAQDPTLASLFPIACVDLTSLRQCHL